MEGLRIPVRIAHPTDGRDVRIVLLPIGDDGVVDARWAFANNAPTVDTYERKLIEAELQLAKAREVAAQQNEENLKLRRRLADVRRAAGCEVEYVEPKNSGIDID